MIEARETLLDLKIAIYPNMSRENRTKLHRELYQQAFPANFNGGGKAMSLESLAQQLGGGNGRR